MDRAKMLVGGRSEADNYVCKIWSFKKYFLMSPECAAQPNVSVQIWHTVLSASGCQTSGYEMPYR